MTRAGRRIESLLLAGGLCGGLFAWLTATVLQGGTEAIDEQVCVWLAGCSDSGLDAAVEVISGLSAPALLVSGCLLLAVALRKKGPAVFLPVALAPFGAMTAGATMTRLLPPRYAPDADEKGREPCFPSGHTTGATVELLVSGYVLVRERIVPPGALALFAAIPIAAGGARLYRRRHWFTDVAAGWLAGASIAALVAAGYEAARERRPSFGRRGGRS